MIQYFRCKIRNLENETVSLRSVQLTECTTYLKKIKGQNKII